MSQRNNEKRTAINWIKSGISIRGIKPEMAIAHSVISSVFTRWGFSAIITSGTSGKHGRASLHYIGHALDYRIKHIRKKLGPNDSPLIIDLIAAQIDEALGNDFDVVLESTHIHVEFQPKEQMT